MGASKWKFLPFWDIMTVRPTYRPKYKQPMQIRQGQGSFTFNKCSDKGRDGSTNWQTDQPTYRHEGYREVTISKIWHQILSHLPVHLKLPVHSLKNVFWEQFHMVISFLKVDCDIQSYQLVFHPLEISLHGVPILV